MSALGCLEEQIQAWSSKSRTSLTVELQEQIRYLQQLTAALLAASKRTKGGVQSLTQTMYATLQQKDNQLNHRYGAYMRLITAITLVFLPGTSVATFFSTTFWDTSPDNNGTKVTGWDYFAEKANEKQANG
ncbi:hypothetical protein G6011_05411 [Alternaria panax]|uniref:Uncharacterized protein n=1 Tax=Alternaria panax TaxID=48097 RepID=A0AAD4FCL0_9PLEO|nr:hypothetical protein G6011_05411 [Alternaria panax]